MFIKYEKTRWGGYDTIANYKGNDYETKLKRLFIEPNKNISYQKHEHRGEAWSVLQGSGVLIREGITHSLEVGMSMSIPSGRWHSVKAGKDGLEIAEVQAGKECNEEDVVRSSYDWNEILELFGKEDLND